MQVGCIFEAEKVLCQSLESELLQKCHHPVILGLLSKK